jgi:hypothetical protein
MAAPAFQVCDRSTRMFDGGYHVSIVGDPGSRKTCRKSIRLNNFNFS